MLKKTSLAVLGLITSSLVSAGTMGVACVPGNATVPCELKQWDLGVQALYLKPTFNSNFVYDQSSTNGIATLNPGWDWGFKLDGSYHFNTGNDLTMDWTHYGNSSEQTGYMGGVSVFNLVTIPNVPYTLSYENRFDQVNLVMGQHVDLGELKNIRFYGGLQYAMVHMNQSNYFLQTPAALLAQAVTSVSQFHNTDYKGVGPLVGADCSYDLFGGLSLTANAGMSLLYGSGRYNDGFAYSNGLNIGTQSNTQLMAVSSLQGKLGANYSHATANGVLNIEGGYQAMNYYNMLQTRGPGSSGFISSSDYGLYGVYLGTKWVANA